MPKKRNKSDNYQYKIVEIAVDPNILGDFPLVDGLGSQLNLAKYSEEFYRLRKMLMNEVLRIIQTGLTPKQREVITLRLQGKTQQEIAEELGKHQTTIHKILKGNLDYQKIGIKRRYGGVIKKLKKLCSKDQKILEILEMIDDLKSQVPYDKGQLIYEEVGITSEEVGIKTEEETFQEGEIGGDE